MLPARARGLVVLAALAGEALPGCARPRARRDPREARLAEIVPLVPEALRVDAARREDTPSARAPALRIERHVFEPAQPGADLAAVARALEARAAAFDAVDPRAEVTPAGRVVLTYALTPTTLRSLVADQLARRGVLELAPLDPACFPFDRGTLPRGVRVVAEPVGEYDTALHLRADPDPARGIAPLEPLRAYVAGVRPPPARAVLIGPVRDRSGDIARRTYCVRAAEALRATRVAEARSSLHPRTLDPVLYVRLTPADAARWLAMTTAYVGRPIVAAVDGEAVVAAVPGAPVTNGWVQILPQARVPGVSPEVLAALLGSGALPADVRRVAGP